MFRPEHEESLHRHYVMLRQYLASSLRDEKGNIRPNRARDKLLRLSVTQFMELSTDVFDELVRREDDRLKRVQVLSRSECLKHARQGSAAVSCNVRGRLDQVFQ